MGQIRQILRTWVQNCWPALPAGPPLALFYRCVSSRCWALRHVLAINLRKGYTVIDGTGSHKNGKHLLGPSPGTSEDALEDEAYDSEEEAMTTDVLAEEQKHENEDEMKDEALVEASETSGYDVQDPTEGNRARGATTRPTPFGALSAGGEEAITKKFSIDNEEELSEMERGLDLAGSEAVRDDAEAGQGGVDEEGAREALAEGNQPEPLHGWAAQLWKRLSSSSSRDAQD